jgi:hypothetical protein
MGSESSKSVEQTKSESSESDESNASHIKYLKEFANFVLAINTPIWAPQIKVLEVPVPLYHIKDVPSFS